MTAMISCIILSAGESRRFGSPKALARLNDETIIERTLKKLHPIDNIKDIILVLGHQARQIKDSIFFNKPKIKLITNKNYRLGQTSSFQAGLEAIAPDSFGAMLLPIDYPLIKAATLESMIREFVKRRSFILVPAFQGHRGHPPLFHRDAFPGLLRMDTSKGINEFIRANQDRIQTYEIQDPGIVGTFNTRQEFQALTKNFTDKQ